MSCALAVPSQLDAVTLHKNVTKGDGIATKYSCACIIGAYYHI